MNDYSERDAHQEHKDDLAQGLIYEDGSPRDQDPPEDDCPEIDEQSTAVFDAEAPF